MNEAKIIKQYLNKEKINDIARKHKISLPALYKILNRNNIAYRGNPTKLTKDEIHKMAIAYCNSNVTQKQLAKKYKVSELTVRKYMKEEFKRDLTKFRAIFLERRD